MLLRPLFLSLEPDFLLPGGGLAGEDGHVGGLDLVVGILGLVDGEHELAVWLE